jgi:hypothetical protein
MMVDPGWGEGRFNSPPSAAVSAPPRRCSFDPLVCRTESLGVGSTDRLAGSRCFCVYFDHQEIKMEDLMEAGREEVKKRENNDAPPEGLYW